MGNSKTVTNSSNIQNVSVKQKNNLEKYILTIII